MPQIETRTRSQIAEFLPVAMNTAIASYQIFSERNLSEDAKEFKLHHDACKVAIAHIELLIKLAQWADLPDPSIENDAQRDVLLGLINSAQGEINDGEEVS